MIFIIAKRQFLSNIFTFRFTISLIVCIILFTASALILNWDYKNRITQYRSQEQESQENLENTNTFASFSVTINRPPSPLSTIAEGADKRTGSSTIVGFDRAPTIVEEAGTDNPLLSIFPSFDIITIIQIIMSLLTLIFAYNVISGERENGTLRLVLSNPVARSSVIIGNLIGGTLSLILPLLMGLIIAAIITMNNPFLDLTLTDFLRIFAIFILGILYLSVFYNLGLMLSSRIRRSATVLIILLFIWVLFVIIIPPKAIYMAKHISPVTDKTVIDDQARALRDEWRREVFNYARAHPRPFFDRDLIRGRSVMSGGIPYAYRLWYAPREYVQWMLDGSIYGHNLRMEYEERIYNLYKDYQSQLKKQVNTAGIFSLLSPSWIFASASSSISATGEENYLRFLDQAQTYRQEIINYMKNKEALSSYRLITRRPVDNFLTRGELISIRDSQGMAAVENIIGSGNVWANVEGLDLTDLPKFVFGNIYSTAMFDAYYLGRPIVEYCQYDPELFAQLDKQPWGSSCCDFSIYRDKRKLDEVLNKLINDNVEVTRDPNSIQNNFPDTPQEFYEFWHKLLS